MSMKSVSFVVLDASSEELEYPAVSLNSYAHQEENPYNTGWQSTKFCDYPQDLVLLLNQGHGCELAQLEILLHPFLIPSKIEFWAAKIYDEDSHHAFELLGEVVNRHNDQTAFEAQELQTVHFPPTSYRVLKLRCHFNYVNELNVFNQVGISQLTCWETSHIPSSSKSSTVEDSDLVRREEQECWMLSSKCPWNSNNSSRETETTLDTSNTLSNFFHSLELLRGQDGQNIEWLQLLHASQARLLTLARDWHVLEEKKRQAIYHEHYEEAKQAKAQVNDLVSRGNDVVRLLEQAQPRAEHKTQDLTPMKVEEIRTNVQALELYGDHARAFPIASPLSSTLQDDMHELIQVFGLYVIECICSLESPVLRIAGLSKILDQFNRRFVVTSQESESSVSLEDTFQDEMNMSKEQLVSMGFVLVERGLEDRHPKVVKIANAFMQSLLSFGFKMNDSPSLTSEWKPMMTLLVLKLGQTSSPALRDAVVLTCLQISNESPNELLKALAESTIVVVEKSRCWTRSWKVLEIVDAVVLEYGPPDRTIVSTFETLLQLIVTLGGLEHAREEIRTRSKSVLKTIFSYSDENDDQDTIGLSQRQVKTIISRASEPQVYLDFFYAYRQEEEEEEEE